MAFAYEPTVRVIEFPERIWAELGGKMVAYVRERTCRFLPFAGDESRELDEQQGICSECSAHMHGQFKFCPNCGADMREES